MGVGMSMIGRSLDCTMRKHTAAAGRVDLGLKATMRRGARGGRWLPAAATLATACLVLAACGSPSRGASTSSTPSSSPTSSSAKANGGNPYWIVADWAVKLLQQNGLSSSLTNSFFNNPHTFLITTKGSKVDAMLPNATLVQRFTSYADMQQAFSTGQLRPGVRAVMYDNEAWNFTPPAEKAQPFSYASRAESLAHQHGMTFIFTPAVNLSTVNSSGVTTPLPTGTTKYQAYLDQNLATQGAKLSDVFDIQAQQAEATPDFVSFATQAVAQARAANPHAVVLVGIGTNPGGRPVTSQDVMSAYSSVRAVADGYWLNVPQGGAQCPQCGPAQPQVAVAFLQALAPSLGF